VKEEAYFWCFELGECRRELVSVSSRGLHFRCDYSGFIEVKAVYMAK